MPNSAFVDVATAPAGAPAATVPDLGRFAPLAGPTTDAQGNVYLGTIGGELIALHADGSPLWVRQLPSDDQILTSPAVGSDGSVYVVGVYALPSIRDHRTNPPSVRDHRAPVTARLYRFLPGGEPAPNGITEFPIFPRGSAQRARGPMAVASVSEPAMWQFGSDEAVIVSALYPTVGGTDLHVFAFSPGGGVMADWTQHQNAGDVYEAGGLFSFLFPGFEPGVLGPLAYPSLPGVAIATNPQGGTPFIVLADRWDSDVVGLTFCVGANCSPAPGFTERFRTSHNPRKLLSPPTILPDWHSAVGTDDGVIFSGPNGTTRAPMSGLSQEYGEGKYIHATPTATADGRTIVVTAGGTTIGFVDRALSQLSLDDMTIARAASSRTHVFVATSKGLHTLNATGSALEVSFPWVGGGVWSPVVGPQGHVYAMASHTLFVFAPSSGGRVPVDRVRDRVNVNPR